MRHSLTTQGYGIRLRPVRLDDAQFIVWLRNLGYVKGRVGDSATDVADQERWLNSYFERKGDYYFIIETFHETPLGTYAVYGLQETRAEIGRLVIRPGVSAAVPATLLLGDLLDRKMGITQLRATCVASNSAARSLFCKCGFSEVKIEYASRVVGGEAIDMVHFAHTTEAWRHARERLIRPAQRAESAIRQWEEAYLQSSDSQRLVT